MLRTKAERGHGSRHSAVSRLVAIALASLLLAGVAAAQTKPETSSEIKTETKSVSGSNHLRAWLVSVGSLSVPRLQARSSRPHRL